MVSVEQTTNIAGGHVWPLDTIRGVLDVARRYGANPAQVLGKDEVGLDALDQVGVEGVQGLAIFDGLTHGAVDVRGRRVVGNFQLGAGDDRLAGGRGGVVAAVGNPFNFVAEPKCKRDLGGRRQQRNDFQSMSRSVTDTERMTSPTWIDLATSMPSMT